MPKNNDGETGNLLSPAPPAKTKPDDEMAVMSRITRILAGVNEPTRERIVRYLAARYTAATTEIR